MNCYFCQCELQLEHFRPIEQATKYQMYDPCQNCKELYGLKVYTVIDHEDGQLLYAHIYVDETTTITVPGPYNLPALSSHFTFGHNYHIRLHLRENLTRVGDSVGDDWEPLLNLPGFPIKPENAREKLKLYLLLS